MPTVSQEDYLLVRGANPRTGVVTPGVRSASSSVDNSGTARDTSTLPTAKWRQKGNEWVSLDPGQPTPVEAYVRRPKDTFNNRYVSTPPKLKPHKYNRDVYSRNSRSGRITEPPWLSKPTPSDIPGSFPLTPSGGSPTSRKPAGAIPRSFVARKPVGDQALTAEELQDRELPGMQNQACGSNPFVPLAFAEDGLRSSSAPMPGRTEYFSPAHVGKIVGQREGKQLPALPPNDSLPNGQMWNPDDRLRRQENDLSQNRARVNWVEDIPPSMIQQQISLGKTLPNLPASDVSGPMHRPKNSKVDNSSAPLMQNLHQGRRKPRCPREDLENPQVMAPPRPRQMQGINTGRTMDIDVPSYDNPPPRRQPANIMKLKHRLQAPRTMTSATLLMEDGHAWHTADGHIETASANVHNDTSMNASGNLRHPHESVEGCLQADSHEHAILSTVSSGVGEQASSHDSIKGLPRPSMPNRAEATHRIPRASQVKGQPLLQHQDFMEQTKSDDTLQRDSAIMRKCSRCRNGFVRTRKQPVLLGNEHNRTPNRQAPRTQLSPAIDDRIIPERSDAPRGIASGLDKEVTLTASDSAVTADVIDEYTDERDHNACCPRCCEDGCHEGCLGHPSPFTTESEHRWNPHPNTASPASSILSSAETIGSDTTMVETPAKMAAKQTHRRQEPSPSPSPARPKRPPPLLWRSNAHDGVEGAVEAARSAMAPRAETEATRGALDAARKAMESSCEIQIRKRKESKRCTTAPIFPSTSPSSPIELGRTAGSASTRNTAASLSRRAPIEQDATHEKSRNVSGTSLLGIHVPTFEAGGFQAAWEVMSVPLRIAWMWIHNHPEVVAHGWTVSQRLLQMARTLAKTADRLWRVGYVYSRTGRVHNVPALIWDVLWSLGYLLVLGAVAAVVMRIVGIAFVVGKLALWCPRFIGFVVLKLLGC